MKKLLLPLGLLVVGLGGGVGAGLVLAPPEADAAAAEACAAPGEEAAAGHGEAADHGAPAAGHGGADAPGAAEASGAAPCEAAEAGHGEEAHGEAHGEAPAADPHGGSGRGEAPAGGHDYVKLPNQFIVPVVEGGEVAALMLLSLSVEVPAGTNDAIAPIEPKLRDSFLRVLFDHANTGGFEGMFTAAGAMRPLRAALLDAAAAASEGLVTDVLILDIVREDR
jgi:hypothetical protein